MNIQKNIEFKSQTELDSFCRNVKNLFDLSNDIDGLEQTIIPDELCSFLDEIFEYEFTDRQKEPSDEEYKKKHNFFYKSYIQHDVFVAKCALARAIINSSSIKKDKDHWERNQHSIFVQNKNVEEQRYILNNVIYNLNPDPENLAEKPWIDKNTHLRKDIRLSFDESLDIKELSDIFNSLATVPLIEPVFNYDYNSSIGNLWMDGALVYNGDNGPQVVASFTYYYTSFHDTELEKIELTPYGIRQITLGASNEIY